MVEAPLYEIENAQHDALAPFSGPGGSEVQQNGGRPSPTSMKTENRAERVRTRLATVGRKSNAEWNETKGTKSLLRGSHLLGIEAAE
jgi:hypothetical protein